MGPTKYGLVLTHRWSLYAGLITWKVHVYSGELENVVLISKWSLYTSGL